jgi:hypothetical protein
MRRYADQDGFLFLYNGLKIRSGASMIFKKHTYIKSVDVSMFNGNDGILKHDMKSRPKYNRGRIIP